MQGEFVYFFIHFTIIFTECLFCKHRCARCWGSKGEQNIVSALKMPLGKTDTPANNFNIISVSFMPGCYGNTLERPLPLSGEEVVQRRFQRKWCLDSRWLGVSLGTGGRKGLEEQEVNVPSSGQLLQSLGREEKHSQSGEMQVVWNGQSIQWRLGN